MKTDEKIYEIVIRELQTNFKYIDKKTFQYKGKTITLDELQEKAFLKMDAVNIHDIQNDLTVVSEFVAMYEELSNDSINMLLPRVTRIISYLIK